MKVKKILLSLGLSALMLASVPLTAVGPATVQAAACKHYNKTNYVLIEATCTSKGTKQRRCDDCGAVIKTYTIPALGHNPSVKTTPATCLATGLSVSTCKRCGKELERKVLPKGDHNYVTKVTKIATTTSEGESKTYCINCGYVKEVNIIPKKNSTTKNCTHPQKTTTVTKQPTCQSTGVQTVRCASCNKILSTTTLPKVGHSYVTKVIKKAGIYNEGLERIYCEYCGTVKEERVIPKLTREVSISASTLTLEAGRHKTVRIVNAVHDVTWRSSNSAVATVDKNGYITAVKAGTATISTVYDGKTYSCRLTVTAKAVSISETSLTLEAGRHKKLRIVNATHDATWSTSNKTIATVDKDGSVTAVKAGSATISARYDGKTYSCKVTVTAKAVSISSTTLSLKEGKQSTLKLNNAASTVTWSSSNTRIATVDKSGVVKGVKAGTATITAACSGKSYTCKVTVTKAPAAVCKHTNVVEDVTKPTCVKAGSKVTRCKDCKKVLKTQTLPATGHKPDSGTTTAATCQKTGKTVYKCTVCGTVTSTKTLPKISHKYDSRVTLAPTTTSTGKEQIYCIYCNKVKETKVIPKLTSASNIMSIPLYLQSNYSKVKYGDGTLATCGQGPTCLAMIASYKSGKTVTPEDVVDLYGNKYYSKTFGTSVNIFSAANNFGIKSVTRTVKTSEVLRALKAGKPVVSVQKKGLFTKTSTYIVLRGIDKNGKILVNSPQDTNKAIYKSSYDLTTQIAKTSSSFLIIS